MCRRDQVTRVLMPDDFCYKETIGSLISSTTIIDSPLVTFTINGKVPPLDHLQQQGAETKFCNNTIGSDLRHPQDIPYTTTTHQQQLPSLPLKRASSDETLSSPPSVSITSLESDTTPNNNEFDDQFYSTRTSKEEQQEVTHSSQIVAMDNMDILAEVSTNEQRHNQVDDSSDTERDASEDDNSSIADDNSSIGFHRCSMAEPLQHCNLPSERQSPVPSSWIAHTTTATHYLASAIKISLDDKIPISLHGRWRVLKRPDVSNRIVEELPQQKTVFVSPIPPLSIRLTPGTTVSSCHSTNIHTMSPPRKDQVRFDTVHQRFFHQTIGDNPSVMIGTPIALDWTYEDDDKRIPLDDFEQIRMTSRKKGNSNRLLMQRLTLNYYQRRNILSYCAGCTEEQLDQAERDVDRARRQRQITAFFSDLWRVEDFVTSMGRKTKRLFHRRRRIG